jgi:hypothetical protein
MFAVGGCAAPFSDFQSARTLGPGEVEATPSYSHVRFRDDGESEKVQDEFGFQFAAGLSERAELRAKYFAVRVSDDDDSQTVSVLAVGPKFSLVEDRVALYTPIGFGFGSGIETSETFQLQPTLLFTLPVSENFELNPSAKAQIWLNEDDADNLLSFNLGAGISNDLSRWALRPEVGLLVNPGEDGSFLHFGLGLSFLSGSRR